MHHLLPHAEDGLVVGWEVERGRPSRGDAERGTDDRTASRRDKPIQGRKRKDPHHHQRFGSRHRRRPGGGDGGQGERKGAGGFGVNTQVQTNTHRYALTIELSHRHKHARAHELSRKIS